jgi:hypothetical protein
MGQLGWLFGQCYQKEGEEHLLLIVALLLPSYPPGVCEPTFVYAHVRDLAALGYLIHHLAPTWSKLENNPDDATKKNQPVSTSRQRFTSDP